MGRHSRPVDPPRRARPLSGSRGEELVTDRFPKLQEPPSLLPDGTVIDGEICCRGATGGRYRSPSCSAASDARRWARKILHARCPSCSSRTICSKTDGEDVRAGAAGRSAAPRLEAIIAGAADRRSIRAVAGRDRSELGERTRRTGSAREQGAEGLMLKRRDARVRRRATKAASWWKWKVDPYTVDAVMIYAQPGHGRRATLHTITRSGCGMRDRSFRSRRHIPG